nr:MMPL family transporter [Actinomycetota bacterium]
MLARLAHTVMRRRWLVIATWVALTAFGGFSAVQVSDRWLEEFSIPGFSAYEANQRVVETFGNGELAPFVAVLRSERGDVTKVAGVERAIERAVAQNPGSRSSSFFSTGDDVYVSKDRRVTFAEIYPAGQAGFELVPTIDPTRKALEAAAPDGVQTFLTGQDPLFQASAEGSTQGPSVLAETAIGGLGALVILLFTFGTLPAIAIPLVIAVASIFNTFSLIWLLTYITDVSLIVQFLVALVGLGVAIDYALLMIFRFREELRHGNDLEHS